MNPHPLLQARGRPQEAAREMRTLLGKVRGSRAHLPAGVLRISDVIRKEAGLSTEQFPVSAYVGSSKNLKDLKDFA